VIGSRIEMFEYAPLHDIFATNRVERVDNTIATAVDEIILRESEAE
jgi:hypothetical protein